MGKISNQFKKYKSTNEGGMIVKLYVLNDTDFCQCCGASVIDLENATFIGDNIGNNFIGVDTYYPHTNDEDDNYIRNSLSRNLLASMVLGSTGWSGFNGKDYWSCTEKDLTDDGKQLVKSLKKLYNGASIRILTFLDT